MQAEANLRRRGLFALAGVLLLLSACAKRDLASPPPPPPPPAPAPAPELPPESMETPPLPRDFPSGSREDDPRGDEIPEEYSETDLPMVVEAPVAELEPALPESVASAPESPIERPALIDKRLRYVTVYYGTNRTRGAGCDQIDRARWRSEVDCKPNGFYGGRTAIGAAPNDSGLEVGSLTVTFPPEHEIGKIERPLSVFSFTLRAEHPDRDVMISELQSFSHDYHRWIQELKATHRRQAFIYVHGYATRFDEAARRAAQIAYDLDYDLEPDFEGLALFYSWPSRGETDAYLADYDAAFDAVTPFNQFLDLIKLQAGIEQVHVIAHSMGNRLVVNALNLRPQPSQPLIGQLVLAAPDIWATEFKTRFLNKLPRLAERVTLYVSDRDRALQLSSGIREDEPRAGQTSGGLLLVQAPGFEAIDASMLPTDFLGHSYYANNDSMLSDIYCLLKGVPARLRPLLMPHEPAWRFRPAGERAQIQAGCQSPIRPLLEKPLGWWVWALAAAALLALAILARRLYARSFG